MGEIVTIETDDPEVLAAREARLVQRRNDEAHAIGMQVVEITGE